MLLKRLMFTLFIVLKITSCGSSSTLDVQLAQQTLLNTWQSDQHIIWELDWTAAPVGGPLTIESWRTDQRYRFEILESASPALIGETLIFNGQEAWQYNRFALPAVLTATTPSLPPVSDAFELIGQLLTTLPESAQQELAQVNFTPAHKFTLTYAHGKQLIFWRDIKTSLPLRLIVTDSEQQVKLNARQFEPLLNPPKNLFEMGDWLR